MLRRGARLCLLAAGIFLAASAALQARAGELGANSFDLLTQFQGYASNGDGSPAYRRVTAALGRKSILDARDAGFGFLRFAASGWGVADHRAASRDMLQLWLTDPATYWRRTDAMFDALDAAGIKSVPVLTWQIRQFPALTGETVGRFIRDPASQSRLLANRYITEFARRYRARPSILFYELTNEFNLDADLDVLGRCQRAQPKDPPACATWENFTTDALIRYLRETRAVLRAADSTHSVSSGFSIPRSNAQHMRARPEFSPGGPDWTRDSAAELAAYLAETHAGLEIISIHLYPDGDAERLGRRKGDESLLLADIGRIARSLGKQLFLGEFGITESGFRHSMLTALKQDDVRYAAAWSWEFQQVTPYEHSTGPASGRLEPGFTDGIIAEFRNFTAHRETPSMPRIVLTWPLSCTRIDHPMTIHASASLGSGIPNRVDFALDGVPIGQSDHPPYQIDFDPRGRPPKQAELTVTARAPDGATSSDIAPVTLNMTADSCKVPQQQP